MPARVVNAATAIVSELNSASRAWHTPSSIFTAARSYAPLYKREDLGSTIRVDVVTLEDEEHDAPETPKTRQHQFAVNIVYQAAVDPADTSAIDAHVLTVEQIHDYYERTAAGKRKPITGLTNTWVYDPKVPDIYDVPKLLDEGIFQSVIELTVVQWRKEAGNTP